MAEISPGKGQLGRQVSLQQGFETLWEHSLA